QHSRGARRAPAVGAGAREVEDLRERPSAHELHREVRAALVVEAELVHGHDARVVELAADVRLLEEAQQAARGLLLVAGAVALEQDLHRELAPEAPVPDAVDQALSAARDLVLDLVAVLRRAEGERVQELDRAALGDRAGRVTGSGRAGRAAQETEEPE